MQSFLAGMTTMGFLVIGLLFVRYWRRSHDGIFGWFAIAFLLLALNQGLPAFFDFVREEQSWVFVLRLLAFAVIIVAIVRKNREKDVRL
jgi:hypothetical protein